MKSSTYYQAKINALTLKKDACLSRAIKINKELEKLHAHKENATKHELKEAGKAIDEANARIGNSLVSSGAITPEQKAKVEAI